jgi:SAM-dependent methyltransferase
VSDIIWATPLYEFLRQCEASDLQRLVLDCGAGGDDPPLSLFYHHGYRTFGLEITTEALAKSARFCQSQNMSLNILRGDMRRIPFAGASFPFVYAFNAIFFMTKPDIARAMGEIERVLRRGGLCYVNFVSVDDPDDRPFCDTTPIRHLLGSEGFAKHQDNEADAYFANFQILRKEKQIVDKVHGQGRLTQANIEYIARKDT